MRRVTTVLFIATALASSAKGHEFWLEPADYRPKENSVVRVTAWLGERFAGQPVLYDMEHCVKYEMVGPAGEGPVVGRSGGPGAFAKTTSSGTYFLGYRSKRYSHTMDPAKFEAYLTEEGLGRIVEERKKLGESGKPGREAYSRYGKAMLVVGTESNSDFSRKLGHPLEIIAQQDPRSLQVDGSMSVVVLHEGQPLADAQVVAVSRKTPNQLLKTTTDATGRASFVITEPGPWMVTTLHMIRLTGDENADWESLWASLTLEVPQPASSTDVAKE